MVSDEMRLNEIGWDQKGSNWIWLYQIRFIDWNYIGKIKADQMKWV